MCVWALAQLQTCYPRPCLIHKVLDRCAQAVVRGGARCLLQVLDRGSQADARRATHVNGRGAKTDACGRSFAVLSTQVSAAGLRLRFEVPRPIPAALWTQVSTVGLRLG